MSESREWGTGTKIVVAVAATIGVGWLFKKAVVASATVGVVGGAMLTLAAMSALQKEGVVVQFPDGPVPPGAGKTLTAEAGDALALRALCASGKADPIVWTNDACPFDADALARVKKMGVTFWGPKT